MRLDEARIAVDVRAVQGARRGMGMYVESLLVHLARQPRRPRITLLADGHLPPPAGPVAELFPVLTRRVPGGQIGWEQVGLPLAARKFDLLHAPANGGPVRGGPRLVVTLHDVIFVRRFRDISAVPYAAQAVGHVYRRWTYPKVARRARIVLTVSEASRAEIASLLRVPPDRIVVTPESLPEPFRAAVAPPLADVFAKYGLPAGRFLLAMGAYERRKNIPFLFEVLERMRSAGKAPPLLLLAGADHLKATRYREEVTARNLKSLVRFLPYVNDGEFKTLQQHAVAFLWPSLREGFGLPLLEAMSCGTPVLASAIPVHREIAGDAARFIDPHDAAGWAAAIDELLAPGPERERFKAAGPARVATFSWDRCAARTLEAYERALA